MYQNFWDIMLDPVFGITFGLVLAGFLPLLWSVWDTWMKDGEIPTPEEDEE